VTGTIASITSRKPNPRLTTKARVKAIGIAELILRMRYAEARYSPHAQLCSRFSRRFWPVLRERFSGGRSARDPVR
jgi:hypothetical protein